MAGPAARGGAGPPDRAGSDLLIVLARLATRAAGLFAALIARPLTVHVPVRIAVLGLLLAVAIAVLVAIWMLAKRSHYADAPCPGETNGAHEGAPPALAKPCAAPQDGDLFTVVS